LSGSYGGYYSGCAYLQTYGVSKTGILTFKGATEFNQGNFGGPLPTITGNGKFAYGFQNEDDGGCGPFPPFVDTFAAEYGGVLASQNTGGFVLPTPPPSAIGWLLAGVMTDDPTDHVATAMSSIFPAAGSCGAISGPTQGPTQLASFTVDSQGNLTTTNTYENMPTLAGDGSPSSMRLDPTGKILAVATGTGIQFFHFNGASPITTFTGIIGTSGYITGMAWDNDGPLYAQNGASGKMHVYEVTTKSANELSGSPTLIPIGTLYGSPVSSFVVRTK
jgi:hypothetical protein